MSEPTQGPWVFDEHRGVISLGEENMAGEPIDVATEVRYEDGFLIAAAPEMQKEITRLRYENQRLREALENMTELMEEDIAEETLGSRKHEQSAIVRARAALSERGGL